MRNAEMAVWAAQMRNAEMAGLGGTVSGAMPPGQIVMPIGPVTRAMLRRADALVGEQNEGIREQLEERITAQMGIPVDVLERVRDQAAEWCADCRRSPQHALTHV
jgi:hypothetical protein